MKIFLILIMMISNVFAASSKEERASKIFELNIQTGYEYRAKTSQVSGMYFLSPNNLIGFKFGSGASGEERQTNISLMYQFYALNSFYIAPEIYYLNTVENKSWIIDQVFNLERKTARYISLGAGISIGNQWSWKNLTLGCDWIGVGKRFGTFHKDTWLLSNDTYTFLNVKIGASF